jgi:hypothetical protein
MFPRNMAVESMDRHMRCSTWHFPADFWLVRFAEGLLLNVLGGVLWFLL